MKLSLAEGLYLIALDDDEGRLLVSAERTIEHGLVAAAILELVVTDNYGVVFHNYTIITFFLFSRIVIIMFPNWLIKRA